jgi:hypothetical protein
VSDKLEQNKHRKRAADVPVERKPVEKGCKALLPCATCPWRVDPDASTIPGYDHQKAVRLLGTVGDGDAFRKIMACHNSTDRNAHACRGYLAQEGWSNLNVRILLARGEILNPSAIRDACETHGVQLEPVYPAVLKKLAASSWAESEDAGD